MYVLVNTIRQGLALCVQAWWRCRKLRKTEEITQLMYTYVHIQYTRTVLYCKEYDRHTNRINIQYVKVCISNQQVSCN